MGLTPNSHAILGPSAATRWTACTPSARFEEQIPDKESPYAKEGTLAHEVADLILSARAGVFKGDQTLFNKLLADLEKEVEAFYDGLGKPSEFNSMLGHAEDYAAFVKGLGPGEILIEQRYDLTKYVPLGFGTADGTNRLPNVLHVVDYKYGAGVRVTATANKQLMLYALGAYEKALADGYIEIKTVALHIYQPRVGGSSSWQIELEDLLTWGEQEIKPKAALAIAGQGEFNAGEHCQFCKAKTVCKAFYDRFAELKGLIDKRVMTAEEKADVLKVGPSVAAWVKKVEEDAISQLSKGEKIPGYKLVNGRGRRSFKSEDEVVDVLLGEGFESYEIFDPKLRSLTDLEKSLGKNKFNELLGAEVINAPGKPTLAQADDDRPAVGASAADEYD